jgi:hypothetical protein
MIVTTQKENCGEVAVVTSQGGSPSVEELVRSSRFIFRGTIERLKAATMPSVPISDGTAVVRVIEVIQAPPVLGDQTERSITVQLATGSRNAEGQDAVFFTNGWLYGESMAVTEIGRLEPAQAGAQLRQEIADANRSIADQALLARIRRAELVVTGFVVESGPLTDQPPGALRTEHDPQWWEALLSVESVEKGQLQPRPLIVLFPESTDEMWIESPKFRVGQTGLWILQLDQQEKGWPILRRPGYTALDPLDFQPVHRLDGIRTLIKAGA